MRQFLPRPCFLSLLAWPSPPPLSVPQPAARRPDARYPHAHSPARALTPKVRNAKWSCPSASTPGQPGRVTRSSTTPSRGVRAGWEGRMEGGREGGGADSRQAGREFKWSDVREARRVMPGPARRRSARR